MKKTYKNYSGYYYDSEKHFDNLVNRCSDYIEEQIDIFGMESWSIRIDFTEFFNENRFVNDPEIIKMAANSLDMRAEKIYFPYADSNLDFNIKAGLN